LAKHNQHNASIGTTFETQETVTITDPCHPLHDQTFPLLFLTKFHNYEPCCMIQVTPGVDRLIPVRQTNLSPADFPVFPSPLDISSLHRLIETYTRILAQVKRECEDEIEGTDPATSGGNPATAGVGDLGCGATAGSLSNNRQSLPADHPDLGTGATA
jgi:hypothetical protein